MKRYSPLGFTLALLPPLLAVVGHLWHFDLLLFLAIFVIGSALRPVVGEVGPVGDGHPEWVTTWVDWIPDVYLLVYGAFLVWTASMLGHEHGAGCAFWLSFFLVSSWASCVAHEAIHRRTRQGRLTGRLIASLAGVPELGFEHLAHHASPGVADYPARSESFWAFYARRYFGFDAIALGYQWHKAEWTRARSIIGSIWAQAGVTALAAAVFTILGGVHGLVCYVIVNIVGVRFTLVIIGYLQHWGLGAEVKQGHLHHQHFAWEDSCRVQYWLVMGLSLHQRHHISPSRPCYSNALCQDSPRAPASYAIMMIVALWPALFFRLMEPALQAWLKQPDAPPDRNGRVICGAAVYAAALRGRASQDLPGSTHPAA